MNKLKTLLFDIEILQTTLGDSWRTMGADHSIITCFGYRWLHEKKAKKIDLLDTGEFEWLDPLTKGNDEELVREAHEIMSQADILVAQFGNHFDQKYMNAKFFYYGLDNLRHIERRDTCMMARSHFKISSKRLDNLADFLGVQRKKKIRHEHWMALWNGQKKSMREISRYCVGDVETLTGVYLKMLPLFPDKQHAGMVKGHSQLSCPACGSTHTNARANRITAAGYHQKRMTCQDCRKNFTVPLSVYAKERG